MDFLNGLAIILLTLVGYSSGSSLGAKGRVAVPAIIDLVVIVALWIAALGTRNVFGRWGSIAVWMVAGLFLGIILARVRSGSYLEAQPMNNGKGLWNAWKGFAQRMGNYQSRVLMAFVYFSIILPFGLGITLLGDFLGIKKGPRISNWQPKDFPIKPSLDEARRQF